MGLSTQFKVVTLKQGYTLFPTLKIKLTCIVLHSQILEFFPFLLIESFRGIVMLQFIFK